MSRNRGTTLCDCGELLGISHAFTRTLSFNEYLVIAKIVDVKDRTYLNYPYFIEYANLIGCGVMCPKCFRLYFYWLGGARFVKEGIKRKNYPIYYGDTSYWFTFSGDEE